MNDINISQRIKVQGGIIIGLFIGVFIARIIDGGSILSAILWGGVACIIPIVLFMLKVDKLIKQKKLKKSC